MPFITVLEANKKGSTYVFGDVHGRLETLETILSNMTPNDVAISVGDLIDRKPNSKEILLKLINAPKDPSLPTIHVVRGNHEHEALTAIVEMEDILIEARTLDSIHIEMQRSTNEQLSFVNNESMGGRWIIDLYIKELKANKMTMVPGDEDTYKINYSDSSEIGVIKQFFLRLPLIIHVKAGVNTPAFHVVHADMPFDDDRVQEVIQSGLMSDDDIDYALNARPELSKQKVNVNGRTENSLKAVCGHSIVGSDPLFRVIRENNTINLDIGSFVQKHCLVLNMTVKNCLYYTWFAGEVVSPHILSLDELAKMDFKIPKDSKEANSPYKPFIGSTSSHTIKSKACRAILQPDANSFDSFSFGEDFSTRISTFFDDRINKKVISEYDASSDRESNQIESFSTSQSSSDSEPATVNPLALSNCPLNQSPTFFKGKYTSLKRAYAEPKYLPESDLPELKKGKI